MFFNINETKRAHLKKKYLDKTIKVKPADLPIFLVLLKLVLKYLA